ncbi:MAG: enoyl-CoA hydratase [Chloroflexi bacterium]|jgi:enoyl-CoA hydratase|nr:enoyl-CoA hydratase [Chloroflexota bacterium]MBG92248.1 enoyl-CoA hydratase [Chloroflexota bacterium]MCL0055061.1 crotonase/enoyl-CoA hydratase family protein [Dehalococcoidia bacterium]HAE32612.1 enoyl-CoA hydratase [Dehalococcoidia bacterium]|tara:strand:- start:9 stop:842 length:834 start_codon:yes stop_codon:yes gene_type:complete
MTYEFIKCEVTDNGVAKVLLNRPEKLNALSLPLQAELYECLQAADDDPAVRVITLRGAGRAFCAGYDVTPPQTDEDRRASEERRGNIRQDMHRLRKTARLMTSVFDLSKPVIAGIHGHVIAGGTDLALHCDMVIAADDANIGFPPVRSMGTPPTHMWTYMVGPQWAKWFMLTGETVSGKEAQEMGLVLKSVPAEGLDAAVDGLANKIAKIPWEMLAANKSIVNKALDLMGRNMMQVIAAETDAVSHQSSIVREFNRISSEEGLKAALAWRDAPFQDD